jgi:phage portal protein BeeE
MEEPRNTLNTPKDEALWIQYFSFAGGRYIDYSPNSRLSSRVFLPEEVRHEKLPNPFDFWRGMPPLAVAATAASTDHAASLFMKGIMDNGDVGTS